jgi:predicted sulfurtransferase
LCLDLDLRGRIIVAPEGLNGTVSGLREHCEKYMQALKADPRFAPSTLRWSPTIPTPSRSCTCG